ncbi:MAG TPA: hypothetical protein PLI42_02640 [Candidatus Pacearchaeota archaeon]|nr:hypothetical protein [Candidatus Pacearchaeota archaeon]HOS12866.1 hypothetical protein [Candidatus Pacearchaeota archaeon]
MAQVPSDVQIKSGFFHSLDITATENNQYPFESLYKGFHNLNGEEIFGEIIPYAVDATQADLNVVNNPTIIKKYEQVSLTEIPGSNKQAWYINDGGKFIRHWISPQDIPHSITADPSYGYQAKLYKQNDELITPTEGVWFCRYSSGIVHFAPGYTPDIMGYGTPKITCYVYIGKSIYDLIASGGGIPEAPNDGNAYARKSLNWVKLLNVVNNTFSVSSPFQSGETLNLTTGTGSISGSCIISAPVVLPNSALNFEVTQQVQIYRNGLLLDKTSDVTYVDSNNLILNFPLDIGETLIFHTAINY